MTAVLLTRMKIWWDNRAPSRSDSGANLVEYMLLLVLIAVIVVLVVTNIGTTLSHKYSDASSQLHP
jgi:Flp pilus assembly pilin Flp